MSDRHRRPYDSVLDLIGWTPMVRLNGVTNGCRTPVYVKCEFMGPGGSIKDRIGLAMIKAAEADGTLKPGGTVVEAEPVRTDRRPALQSARAIDHVAQLADIARPFVR